MFPPRRTSRPCEILHHCHLSITDTVISRSVAGRGSEPVVLTLQEFKNTPANFEKCQSDLRNYRCRELLQGRLGELAGTLPGKLAFVFKRKKSNGLVE